MWEKEILCEDERYDNHSELPYKGFIGKELYLMILVYGSNAEINLFSKIWFERICLSLFLLIWINRNLKQ